MVQVVPMKDLAGYLTYDRIELIINACENQRDRVLFTLLSRTGRRVSEVVRSLKPHHIHWKDCLIEWTILKKNPRKRRDDGTLTPKADPFKKLAPVPKDVISMVGEFIKSYGIRDDQYIFDISRQRVNQILKKAGEKAGIETVGSKPLHPHHFRHSFLVLGSENAKTPKDLILLKEMAGHSKVETTVYYLQFNSSEQKNLLGRMFKKSKNDLE